MAKDKKPYSSIIDEILDSRAPDFKALGLNEAEKSGEEQLDRTHQYADVDWLDELANVSAARAAKSATLSNRLNDKEKAAPRINSIKADWHRKDEFSNSYGDNDSLIDEVTMSIEKAQSEGSVEKKEILDGQIQNYIKNLLNQGTSPAKVAAKLEKLAELELFNHQMATDYLQRNAGMMGLAYLEPNTFMDKQNPNYRHTAAEITKDVRAPKQAAIPPFQGLPGDEDEYNRMQEEQYDHMATPAEADREWATNVGQDHPERAWILSDRDVWYQNPAYQGPRVPHPEDDYDAFERLQEQTKHYHALWVAGDKDHPNSERTMRYHRKWQEALTQLKKLSELPEEKQSSNKKGAKGFCPKCTYSMTRRNDGIRVCDKCGYREGPYADKNKQKSSSQDCLRQHTAWKQQGIVPQAYSVKQISACEDCSYFKKDATGKRCNLYHLPVVANTKELSQIVNNLTPGVPNNRKHAALVQIANRIDQHAQPFNIGTTPQMSLGKSASAHADNQARREAPQSHKFYASHVAQLHDKGVAFKAIYAWADKKFGSLDTSIAFRGFVQSLRKNASGRIVLAKSDLQFLNSIGIRNEMFQGEVKCASCPAHFGQTGKPENGCGVMRAEQKVTERTVDRARFAAEEKAKPIEITALMVRKLHHAGHSVEKIYNASAGKIGSLQAKKVVTEFVASLRQVPDKVGISEADRSFLVGKLGMKPEAIRTLDAIRPTPDHVVNNKKVASNPADGLTMLNEYELVNPVNTADIDTSGPDFLDINQDATYRRDVD